MDSRYDHVKTEDHIYTLWEKSGGFAPSKDTSKKPFTIIMPPPNANDPLHIGHAMFVTIEDILIRFHRMIGDATLWLPGTDHAGIETQFVFEKKLAKQDKSRFDFDRETLYKMIWEYVQENSGVAVGQMKRLGASADWERFTFTLDPQVVDFVYDTFIKLYKDALVYRAEKLVNYCTKCGTGYSELEVNHIEEKAKLYFLKYGPFTLATTRPETKFGDTAVAVHPTDKRYKKYIGQDIEVEGLLGTFKLKVIGDTYVDPAFGTGVVKITPFHDFNDFEVWQRHKAEIPAPKQIIDLNGRLNEHAGIYKGLKIKAAREALEKDLREKGFLVDVKDDYVHTIGVCYRCKTVLEPLPLPQFFISVKPLTEKALASIGKKQIKFHGAGREKILIHWLTNLKDWNVSRQIVWGIRLPVWYDVSENEERIMISFIDKNKKVRHGTLQHHLEEKHTLEEIKYGLQQIIVPIYEDKEHNIAFKVQKTEPEEKGLWIQETDTFDTWFSSGQWPVVTLSARNGDLDRFYPTSVMETAYEILPFWVMRMIMLGLYLTDKVPFKDVYLHGLVRDAQGRKMSKSIGNVVNPIELVEKYGADAIRMGLVMGSTPGQDKSVGEQTIKGMRNLSNKIWNATRFIINFENDKNTDYADSVQDQAFNKQLTNVSITITKQLNDLKIGLAAETIYNEFWHWFCDKCIEDSKKGQLSSDAIKNGLTTFLKLLHPFVPFVTESCWQELQNANLISKDTLLMNSEWPQHG